MGLGQSVANSFVTHDQIVRTQHVRPGDLIEVQRGFYRHWAMCESVDQTGNVWCFHVRDMDDLKPGQPFDGKAALKLESLDSIVKDGRDLSVAKCRVNNQTNTIGGHEAQDTDKVLASLRKQKERLLPYNPRSLNSESYATLWKYGFGWSNTSNYTL